MLGNLIISYHKGITNELNIVKVNLPTSNKGIRSVKPRF